jgi:hypothetical protein
LDFTLAAFVHWGVLEAYIDGREFKPQKISFGIKATFWLSPTLAIASLGVSIGLSARLPRHLTPGTMPVYAR